MENLFTSLADFLDIDTTILKIVFGGISLFGVGLGIYLGTRRYLTSFIGIVFVVGLLCCLGFLPIWIIAIPFGIAVVLIASRLQDLSSKEKLEKSIFETKTENWSCLIEEGEKAKAQWPLEEESLELKQEDSSKYTSWRDRGKK